jgi:hypothetical protein
MQYISGVDWRRDVCKKLSQINVTCFDPYQKPFMKDVTETEDDVSQMKKDMKEGNFDLVSSQMRTIRSYDLNLVDRSDFIIAHLIPDLASWGSAEEIVTAVRMKKPTFISIEGGKNKTPLWLMGMIPHKYIYNSLDEIISMLYNIDNGEKSIDSDRWRLLQKEYR